MTDFQSSKEFREVMDRTFALMSEDPDMIIPITKPLCYREMVACDYPHLEL